MLFLVLQSRHAEGQIAKNTESQEQPVARPAHDGSGGGRDLPDQTGRREADRL
jgi:hypothetical protein